jgi:hypothetical protein
MVCVSERVREWRGDANKRQWRVSMVATRLDSSGVKSGVSGVSGVRGELLSLLQLW